MTLGKSNIEFFRSALCKESCFNSLSDFHLWFKKQREKTHVKIEMIPFSELKNWEFDKKTSNLKHSSGQFFSVEGIRIKTNRGVKSTWEQPIIKQPEIGYLGIISKKLNGVLHFLMQAKIEPGNLNYVQLSPTLQATKSNYTQVHKGKIPLYLEYFNGKSNAEIKILSDQLQSEQGARFLKKRNRNIIIEIKDDVPVYDNFFWLTLGQIKDLLKHDNLVNMDTRTVISGISFLDNLIDPDISFFSEELQKNKIPELQKDFLLSAIDTKNSKNTFDDILSWLADLKFKYELDVQEIPLSSVSDWIKTDYTIHHIQKKYFSVIAANIEIGNREVFGWTQPLIKSAQEGIIAFIIKKINGVYHFLTQAKTEAGNFDIVELAPTVQCLTGNYRKGENEYDVPFLDIVLNVNKEQILYKTMQSEEGGRFYKEQNLNMILELKENDNLHLPENYKWLTLNQLLIFIKFNNYLNIQARSLISAINFRNYE